MRDVRMAVVCLRLALTIYFFQCSSRHALLQMISLLHSGFVVFSFVTKANRIPSVENNYQLRF